MTGPLPLIFSSLPQNHMENGDASCKSQVCALIAKRASDVMTQTNKPEWRTIFLKHFIKQPVFQKHIFELKTLPRFPLVLSDRAGIV